MKQELLLTGAGFAAVLAVLFIELLRTLSPSIAGGDSGELVAEGCILGTAHPPGYPLFTLLVHALVQLRAWLGKTVYKGLAGGESAEGGAEDPLGSVAYHVNVSSAVLTVGAAFCIGCIVSLASPKKAWGGGGSVVAMGLFTFSPLIWQYATTAEVFPLNTFFASLILLLVLLFAQRGNFSIALLGAFVCGLALCNQHTIILYEAPLILFMVFLLRRRLIAKPIGTCLSIGLAFFLGLLPYAYLPIIGTLSPKHGSWGHVSTLEGFLHHFLRRDYGTFKLFSGEQGRNAEGFWVRNSSYARDAFFEQGLYCAPVFAIVGILAGLFPWGRRSVKEPQAAGGKNSKKPTQGAAASASAVAKEQQTLVGDSQVSVSDAAWTPLAFLLTQLFYFGVFHNLANLPLHNKLLYGIHQRFWMQPNVLLFTWAGIGYNWLWWLLGAGLQRGTDVASGVSSFPRLFSSLSLWRKKRPPVRVPTAAASTSASSSSSSSSTSSSSSSSSASDAASEKAARPQSPLAWVMNAVVSVLSLLGALALVRLQHQRWLPISDQSDALYWKKYASAILEGLPRDSVLLINYDMQWTSVRYMQKCEKFRDDVTAINLSMMTYTWFHHKRSLYPNLTWPGTYLAPPNDPRHQANKAFTLRAFLDANVDKHHIFLGGKVNYADSELDQNYNFVPAGLVSKIIPQKLSPNGTAYSAWNQMNWVHVSKNLDRLPSMQKYPEETWEWTINRDFRDRVMDTSAYLLETAIIVMPVDPQPLVDAVYWLETSVLLEQTGAAGLVRNLSAVPASLLKNVGLGHIYLVQSKLLNSSEPLLFSYDFFVSGPQIGWPGKTKADWKLWCADQFALYWGAFVEHPDARRDPQFDAILETYKKATTKPTG